MEDFKSRKFWLYESGVVSWDELNEAYRTVTGLEPEFEKDVDLYLYLLDALQEEEYFDVNSIGEGDGHIMDSVGFGNVFEAYEYYESLDDNCKEIVVALDLNEDIVMTRVFSNC